MVVFDVCEYYLLHYDEYDDDARWNVERKRKAFKHHQRQKSPLACVTMLKRKHIPLNDSKLVLLIPLGIEHHVE